MREINDLVSTLLNIQMNLTNLTPVQTEAEYNSWIFKFNLNNWRLLPARYAIQATTLRSAIKTFLASYILATVDGRMTINIPALRS